MADAAGMPPAPRADLDAEAAVLSALLLDWDTALEALEILVPEDFYADANRRIFMTIRDLHASGSKVDVVCVSSKLRADGRFDQVGGAPYLAQLADATPATANVIEHARIIRGLARIRRAGSVFAMLSIEAKGATIDNPEEWLESCESRACAATGERHQGLPTAADYRTLSAAVYEQISKASLSGKPSLGRSTGFSGLDTHLGGLEGGDLIIIAGRPGMGKTALALQIAESIAQDVSDPGAGIVFSLEMTREQLQMRSFARVGGESMRALRSGRPANWSNVTTAAAKLATLPIIVDDEPGLTPLRMRAKIRRHQASLRDSFPHLPLGVVVVDYIQLMGADFVRRGGTRAEEIGQITRALKLAAKELNCTVIALSQLRRPPQGKAAPRPELAELRDSGAIEQDADVVIAIHREDAYRPPGEKPNGKAEFLILKGRKSGEGAHFVHFDGARTAFYDDEESNGSGPLLPFTNGGGNTSNGYATADDYDARYP